MTDPEYNLSTPIGLDIKEYIFPEEEELFSVEAHFSFEDVVPRKHLDLYTDIAIRAAQESYCERKKVGAVVVTKHRGIFIGYNGTGTGQPNVCELEDGTTDPRVFHAEQNAFDKMLKEGVSASGAVVFTTLSPCIECAKRIVGAGVKAAIFTELYRNAGGIQYLEDNGVETFRYDGERLYYAWDFCEVFTDEETEHEQDYLAYIQINGEEENA